MQNATNFREYPRGRQLLAADWTVFGSTDPTSFALNGVEIDSSRQQWLSGGRLTPFPASGLGGLLWTAADGAPGHADQEVRVRVLLTGVDANVAILRASGNPGGENGYILRVEPSLGNLKLLKNVNGVLTIIRSTTKPFTSNSFAGFVIRANGTTITAKGWLESGAEPVTWDLTVTDTSIADGSLGLCTDAQPLAGDVFFFAFGSNGDAAPLETFIPAGVSEWSSHDGIEAELTAELEVYDPDSGNLEKVFFSTVGRRTGPGDWPPNATFFPLLVDPGNLAVPLSGDDFAPTTGRASLTTSDPNAVTLPGGQLAITLGDASIRNPMIQLDGRLQRFLDFVITRTMAGRRYTVRAGRRKWSPHRWFETLFTGTPAGEPQSGDTLDITLSDPYWRLQQTLQVTRNIGIQTCIVGLGAGLISPVNAAYDLTSFTVTWKFYYNGGIISLDAGMGKGLSPTAENFALFIEGRSGKVFARASCAGQSGAIFLRTPGVIISNGWHTVVFGVDGVRTAYLIVDQMVIGPIVPPALVDTPSVGVNLCVNNAGHNVMDARVYNFCMEIEDAQSVTAALAAPDDPGVVSMWRCDDGLGPQITDYAALANHITITGTVNVNYIWVPSYQGQQSAAGTPQPLSYGAVFNAPAVKVDDGREIYRMSDVDNSFLAMTIKAKGLVLTSGADYAVSANGTVTMTGAQTEPVTYDIALGQQSSRLGAILEDALVNRAGFTPESLDLDACTITGQILPYTVALYTASDMTGADFLDALLTPVGGHVRIDRDSRLSPGVLLPPITPGPYPGEPALEFSGLDRSRVLFDGNYGGGFAGSHTIILWAITFSTEKYLEMDTDPNPNRQTLAMKGDGVAAGYKISLYQPLQGAVSLGLPGLSSSSLVSAPGALAWGVWTMIVCRYDQTAGTYDVYTRLKNGALVRQLGATGITGSLTLGTGALQIGGARGVGSVNGSAQHFQVWNSALSLAAIEAIGIAHPVGTESGLTTYVPVTEGRKSVAREAVSGASGTIYGCRWAPRAIFDFRKSLTASTFVAKNLRPAWDVKLTYAKNQSVLADADIADLGVSAAERAGLKRPNKTARSPSMSLKTAYLDSREISPETALMVDSEAAKLARNLRLRYAPKRLMCNVGDAPRVAMSLIPTDEIWAYHPDLPPQGGAFRIVGYAPDFSRLRFALDGWGQPLDPVAGDVLIDAEGNTLLVQGPGDTLRTA